MTKVKVPCNKPQNPVQMAVIGAAHGIKGELRVKTFTGEPLALADYGPLYARDGRAFQIVDIRPANTVVVVRFKGISDRNAAEALAGTELFVDRSVLPDDGEEDEFYHADLIGLEVRDDTGAAHRQGRRGAQFRRRRHPRCDAGRAQGRADPVHAGRRAASVARRGFCPRRPGGGRAHRRRGWRCAGEEDFDPKGRPRGPRDAGGNR